MNRSREWMERRGPQGKGVNEDGLEMQRLANDSESTTK
jgi:hypothetical protein